MLSKYIPLLEILFANSAFSHELILLSQFCSHGYGQRSSCCLCFVYVSVTLCDVNLLLGCKVVGLRDVTVVDFAVILYLNRVMKVIQIKNQIFIIHAVLRRSV